MNDIWSEIKSKFLTLIKDGLIFEIDGLYNGLTPYQSRKQVLQFY